MSKNIFTAQQNAGQSDKRAGYYDNNYGVNDANANNLQSPVITTEEIESLKLQIVEQFWLLSQSFDQKEAALKQSLRDDITKIVEKLEHVLTALDENL